jgi:hypothetical protein
MLFDQLRENIQDVVNETYDQSPRLRHGALDQIAKMLDKHRDYKKMLEPVQQRTP